MGRAARLQAGQEAAHRRAEALDVDQEGIVSLRRIQRQEARVDAARAQPIGDLLLRHQLNRPAMEYHPNPEEWTTTSDTAADNPSLHYQAPDDSSDDGDDERPPF